MVTVIGDLTFIVQEQSIEQTTEESMSKSMERKYFLCSGQAVKPEQLSNYPNAHIIGELCYVTDEQRRVTALALYEISVTTAQAPAETPAVRCFMIGDARRIKCTCCESKQRWEIGKAAALQLFSRYMNPPQ